MFSVLLSMKEVFEWEECFAFKFENGACERGHTHALTKKHLLFAGYVDRFDRFSVGINAQGSRLVFVLPGPGVKTTVSARSADLKVLYN